MQGPAENRTQIQAAQPPAAPGQAPIGPCTALRLCEYHHGRDALHILTPPSTVRSISKRGPGPRSKLLVLCELFGRPERLGGLDLSGPGCELHPLQQRASGSADVMIPAWEPLSYSGPPTPPPAREGVQEQRRYPWGSAYSPMDCLLPNGLPARAGSLWEGGSESAICKGVGSERTHVIRFQMSRTTLDVTPYCAHAASAQACQRAQSMCPSMSCARDMLGARWGPAWKGTSAPNTVGLGPSAALNCLFAPDRGKVSCGLFACSWCRAPRSQS